LAARPGAAVVLGAALAAGLAAGAWAARRGLLYTTVTGASMLPALREGDRLLVRRVDTRRDGGRRLRVGQIVVCPVQLPDGATLLPAPGDILPRLWVKRIAALPGDPMPAAMAGRTGPVPNGTVILLGDNPEQSVDSRTIGPIPLERLVGRVVYRFGRDGTGNV
jgi:signal peptidase I